MDYSTVYHGLIDGVVRCGLTQRTTVDTCGGYFGLSDRILGDIVVWVWYVEYSFVLRYGLHIWVLVEC